MASRFGGIAIEEEPRTSRFGGVPVAEDEEPSLGDRIIGGLETAATVASSAIAEPLAGLVGLTAAANPLLEEGAGARAVEATRSAFTFQPRTEAGQSALQATGEFLEPVTEAISAAEETVGQAGFELAGPIGGAAGETLVTAIPELLGLKGIRGFKRIQGSAPSDAAASVLEAGERLEVPVLTTDVVPPTTFLGKFTQSMSEKLGPLGTGQSRSVQQVARQNVVEELAKEFSIELDSDFAGDIVKSLNKETARKLEKASVQRNKAIASLDQFGNVSTNRTVSAIDTVLARQERLGAKADQSLVSNLNDIKSAVSQDQMGFSITKDIRTEIIDDLKTLDRADDRRALGALQSVKSALDKDMVAFARTSDRNAAADWLRSNRAFAEELTKTKQTELKRILNTGTTTPEKVIPILLGGKRSELNRLNQSLTAKGRSSARAAIIKDALDKSGFFRGDINPDKLATELSRTNKKQAVDIFFKGDNKKQLDGLVDLLNATRRAQQSAAAPATGIQTIPLLGATSIGAGAATDIITTGGVVGSLSGIAKAYESKPFRNLLLKIGNRSKSAPIDTGLLESGLTGLISVFQGAKTEREERE